MLSAEVCGIRAGDLDLADLKRLVAFVFYENAIALAFPSNLDLIEVEPSGFDLDDRPNGSSESSSGERNTVRAAGCITADFQRGLVIRSRSRNEASAIPALPSVLGRGVRES